MINQASAVETLGRALEVTVIWGDSELLRVDHLQPVRPYCVGEHDADLTIGAELLGTPRLTLITESGAVAFPEDGCGEVQVGNAQFALGDLIASGHAQREADGRWSYALPPGGTARIAHSGFTFVVRSIDAVRVAGLRDAAIDYRQQLWTALSFALHALFVGAMYLMPPGASALSLDVLGDDARLAKYLLQPAEVVAPPPEWLQSTSQSGTDGAPTAGEPGQSGNASAPKRKTRQSFAGDAAQQKLARQDAQLLAKSAGILGALPTAVQGGPSSLFGSDTPLGYDPVSALGAVFGDQPGESFGFGGAVMRGPGRGGAGDVSGAIDVGKVGTVGRSNGGQGDRYGAGVGGMGTRKERAPLLRSGTPEVRGSLSKEVIRRAIHQRLNEISFCYEQELHARPDLRGRVQVKFVIGPDGAVRAASMESSTLDASRAEACIQQAVRRFSFPAPDGGGVVIVSYPFVFDHP